MSIFKKGKLSKPEFISKMIGTVISLLAFGFMCLNGRFLWVRTKDAAYELATVLAITWTNPAGGIRHPRAEASYALREAIADVLISKTSKSVLVHTNFFNMEQREIPRNPNDTNLRLSIGKKEDVRLVVRDQPLPFFVAYFTQWKANALLALRNGNPASWPTMREYIASDLYIVYSCDAARSYTFFYYDMVIPSGYAEPAAIHQSRLMKMVATGGAHGAANPFGIFKRHALNVAKGMFLNALANERGVDDWMRTIESLRAFSEIYEKPQEIVDQVFLHVLGRYAHLLCHKGESIGTIYAVIREKCYSVGYLEYSKRFHRDIHKMAEDILETALERPEEYAEAEAQPAPPAHPRGGAAGRARGRHPPAAAGRGRGWHAHAEGRDIDRHNPADHRHNPADGEGWTVYRGRGACRGAGRGGRGRGGYRGKNHRGRGQ